MPQPSRAEPEPYVHDHEAELSVLGGMLTDAACASLARDLLPVDAYHLDAHKAAHRAILAILARSEEPDVALLASQLTIDGMPQPEARSLAGTIGTYICSLPSLRGHIRTVMELAARRGARRDALRLIRDSEDPSTNFSDLLVTTGKRIVEYEASLNGNRVDELQAATLDGQQFDACEFAEPRSIIGNGLLWSQQLGFLFGDTGLGKSFLLEQLAHSAAAGEQFMGLSANEPIPVLIVHMELGAFQVRERRSTRYRSTPPLLHTLTTDRLGRNLNLLDPAEVASFSRLARSLGILLTIFDPLQELHDEGEDNSAFHKVVRATTTYMLTSGSAVVMGHHENKPPQDSKHNERTDLHAFRGGTRAPGAAKLMARLVAVPGGKFKLVWAKATNRKKPDPVFLRQADNGWFDMTDPPPAAGDKTTQAIEKALLLSADGMTLKELIRSCQSVGAASSDRGVQSALDRFARSSGFQGRADLQVARGKEVLYVHPTAMKGEVHEVVPDFMGGNDNSDSGLGSF